MALRIFSALERVSNDESVLELSEDLGRIFSITSDNLTINFWPAIIFAAVIVITIVPLAQIIYSLWSPLLGQFSVDGVQAKNDHIHSRPGNFKYSGFRRSLAVDRVDDILESIDTDLMEERMKVLAQRAKKGLSLLQNIVYIG